LCTFSSPTLVNELGRAQIITRACDRGHLSNTLTARANRSMSDVPMNKALNQQKENRMRTTDYRAMGEDEIPAGTFHGEDRVPAGTFH
jgi:hypothetical protein